MENKPYGSVIGSKNAPYENELANACGLATDYRAITHPSLPNYLAATGGSTFGVPDDAGPRSHPIAATSLFQQLTQAGLSWRAYDESMPTTCDVNPSGRYAVKHNPATYYTAVRQQCAVDDVPLEGHLSQDIASGNLPAFAFVTPQLVWTTPMTAAYKPATRGWQRGFRKSLPLRTTARANTLIVLTWDEGVGATNLIPTIVIGPSVPTGAKSAAVLTHYSLLHTTEELLGLPGIGAATTATSMTSAFHL